MHAHKHTLKNDDDATLLKYSNIKSCDCLNSLYFILSLWKYKSYLPNFHRRGSNLSLQLDVTTLGVEPICSVSTPKEVWLQLLHTSSRPLKPAMLQQAARDTNALNSEYQVKPHHLPGKQEAEASSCLVL